MAGANADDIGNQAGGWTVTWQGSSGDIIPGTTILDGIEQNSSHVTYSADASAPMSGDDVGIVVIGEKPYAEGVGDVGNGHTLNLSDADKANIDKVCSAIRTCVVLDVAGRPQIVTDQLSQMDAFVMSWLPGSEGAGVADVLFGKRPFTGRLPVTAAQRGPGADQHRRPGPQAAVPLRLRAPDPRPPPSPPPLTGIPAEGYRLPPLGRPDLSIPK